MFDFQFAVIGLVGGFLFGFTVSYLERCRRLFRLAFWVPFTIFIFSGIAYDVFFDQAHGFTSTFFTMEGLVDTALVFIGYALGNRLDYYTSPQRKAPITEKVPISTVPVSTERDWSKELNRESQSVGMVRGYFLLMASVLALMVTGFVTMFYAIKFFNTLVGFAFGLLFVAAVGTFVYEYYERIKQDFGKFGLALQLWLTGPLGIGLWIPNKIITEESGIQVAKTTGIKSVPHLALDWAKPIEKEPAQTDLIFWRGFPMNVNAVYLTAKYVGEYESKQFGVMPKFQVLFAPSMVA